MARETGQVIVRLTIFSHHMRITRHQGQKLQKTAGSTEKHKRNVQTDPPKKPYTGKSRRDLVEDRQRKVPKSRQGSEQKTGPRRGRSEGLGGGSWNGSRRTNTQGQNVGSLNSPVGRLEKENYEMVKTVKGVGTI